MDQITGQVDWARSHANVRLTGLRGAAQLNGREGVIRGVDPANAERKLVRFVDGSEVKP
jgi:hypothetical protein